MTYDDWKGKRRHTPVDTKKWCWLVSDKGTDCRNVSFQMMQWEIGVVAAMAMQAPVALSKLLSL